MPLLLQICTVIVTMALLAIAAVTVRAMIHFEKAAKEFSRTADAVTESLAQVKDVTTEIHNVAISLGRVVPTIQGVVGRFEELGERTAELSNAVLDQVEPPIRTAAAVMSGVRSATSYLVRALTHPSTNRRSPTNGGIDHARSIANV